MYSLLLLDAATGSGVFLALGMGYKRLFLSNKRCPCNHHRSETGFSGVMLCAAGAYPLALIAYLFRLGSRRGQNPEG